MKEEERKWKSKPPSMPHRGGQKCTFFAENRGWDRRDPRSREKTESRRTTERGSVIMVGEILPRKEETEEGERYTRDLLGRVRLA